MNELQENLYRLITRKSFRRWALPADAPDRIKIAVNICTAAKNR